MSKRLAGHVRAHDATGSRDSSQRGAPSPASRLLTAALTLAAASLLLASPALAATETAKLIASDGQEFDALGSSVAIDGDTIVAGAPLDNVGGNNAQGPPMCS